MYFCMECENELGPMLDHVKQVLIYDNELRQEGNYNEKNYKVVDHDACCV